MEVCLQTAAGEPECKAGAVAVCVCVCSCLAPSHMDQVSDHQCGRVKRKRLRDGGILVHSRSVLNSFLVS